jgi:hypothetical protein
MTVGTLNKIFVDNSKLANSGVMLIGLAINYNIMLFVYNYYINCFDGVVLKLIGIFDKRKNNDIIKWPHVYKIFFLCEINGCQSEYSFYVK